MDPVLNYISNYGFPMVVAAYLLVRIEGKLEQLSDSINHLTQVITGKM